MNPNDTEPQNPSMEASSPPSTPEPTTIPTETIPQPTPPFSQPGETPPVADPIQTPPASPVEAVETIPIASPPFQSQDNGQSAQLKSIFLKVLIGCLIAAAVVAVIAILAGGLGDIGSNALGTIVVVAIHALLALGFLNLDGTRDEAGELKVFTNVVFGILVLSFITAIFSIWDVISGDTTGKIYLCYGVLIVAVLHGEVLARTLNHQNSTDNTVYANFVTMALVVVMLWLWILSPELVHALDPFFLRILAAAAVIDGTLTMTAIILDRLYLSKHPELITPTSVVTKTPHKGPSLLVIIVLVLLGLQVLPALFFSLFG
jgi:hypothetical protein